MTDQTVEHIALAKDERWNLWPSMSYEYMTRFAKKIALCNEVPEDVRKGYRKVQSIVRLSYFDYELTDVAMDCAIISFEKALKLRYGEMTGNIKGNTLRLEKLIKWGSRQGLFTENEEIIQKLRELRNISFHRPSFQLLGYLALHALERIAEMINVMYKKREG